MVSLALQARARQLLCEALMISEASAAQTTQIGHGHPSSAMPPGAFTGRVTTLQACGARVNRAIASNSDVALAAAIDWCEGELERIRHGSTEVPETPAEFDARIVRDYEGVTAPEVARAERTYVRRVRDARLEHRRTARFGYRQDEQEGA
jgi:hypothetical protein